MHLLVISLYEFGQFLEILLWIFLPLVMVSVLVTTYIHYRNKRRQKEQEEQFELSFAIERMPETLAGTLQTPREEGDSPYKGLLWMKDKYERDRELADAKYERLKEALSKSEEKYLESMIEQNSLRGLLGEKDLQIGFLQSELEQRIKNYHLLEYESRADKSRPEELPVQQLPDDLQTTVNRLNEQLQQEARRSAELVNKLEFSSQLFLKIYKELDRLPGVEPDSVVGTEPVPAPAEEMEPVKEAKIVSWIESASAEPKLDPVA